MPIRKLKSFFFIFFAALFSSSSNRFWGPNRSPKKTGKDFFLKPNHSYCYSKKILFKNLGFFSHSLTQSKSLKIYFFFHSFILTVCDSFPKLLVFIFSFFLCDNGDLDGNTLTINLIYLCFVAYFFCCFVFWSTQDTKRLFSPTLFPITIFFFVVVGKFLDLDLK